jgi:hypothetical protein
MRNYSCIIFIFFILNMPRKQTGELTPTQIKHRNAKERDAKFRDFIQRQDVIEEAAILKKSKRIGHMKARFEAETGYKIPLSMVYKNMNKVYPKSAKVTDGEEKKEYVTFASDDDEKDIPPESHPDTDALAGDALDHCEEEPSSAEGDNSDSELQIV